MFQGSKPDRPFQNVRALKPKFYVVQKGRVTDLEAPKLFKGRSGGFDIRVYGIEAKIGVAIQQVTHTAFLLAWNLTLVAKNS